MKKYEGKVERGDMIITCRTTREVVDIFIANCKERLDYWKRQGVYIK